MREALEQAALTSKFAAANLEERPDMPDICWHVWRFFLDLCKTRWSNGYSALPITEAEIYFYCENRHLSLSPEELYLLREADEAAREQLSINSMMESNLRE